MSGAPLIGVDWGTSNLRACLFGADGAVLERRGSDQGIQRIETSGHEAVLSDLVDGWLPAGERPRILMCGMIGSRQGWREAPYALCPAGLAEIAAALIRVETDWADVWIAPGLSILAADNRADVMRGEETQILGLAPESGEALVIAPGTHSKWAEVNAGRVSRFRTYLTGELYELLSRHSILARLMEGDAPDGACFALGAEREAGAVGGVAL
ncbi:MAG: 2-dehydro-3-deoxygalactonokinase, partial [Caulobacteraceae bacterium]